MKPQPSPHREGVFQEYCREVVENPLIPSKPRWWAVVSWASQSVTSRAWLCGWIVVAIFLPLNLKYFFVKPLLRCWVAHKSNLFLESHWEVFFLEEVFSNKRPTKRFCALGRRSDRSCNNQDSSWVLAFIPYLGACDIVPFGYFSITACPNMFIAAQSTLPFLVIFFNTDFTQSLFLPFFLTDFFTSAFTHTCCFTSVIQIHLKSSNYHD